jgi:uncharacterized membrane protein (UPF0127 family)
MGGRSVLALAGNSMILAIADRLAAGRIRALALALLAVFAMTPLAACSGQQADAAAGTGEDMAVLHTSTGDYAFKVEIADDNAERAQGLMYRKELADDAGMLFDFETEREASFWMQNTFIPLDMIFIAGDGTVKTIHANARPHDPTAIRSRAPVRFVLEIPGGRAKAIGLAVGDTLEHPRVGTGAE